jgi:hypothetical protein
MSEKFLEDHKLETYKSMISVSVEAFKLLALLNGGAAAGMLAAYDRIRTLIPHHFLVTSMAAFVLGLILVAGAFVCSYMTQFQVFNEAVRPREFPAGGHVTWIRRAFACSACSLICFAAGALVAAFSAL